MSTKIKDAVDRVAGSFIGGFFVSAAQPMNGIQGSVLGRADELKLHAPLDILRTAHSQELVENARRLQSSGADKRKRNRIWR
jgi:hypothetical protein